MHGIEIKDPKMAPFEIHTDARQYVLKRKSPTGNFTLVGYYSDFGGAMKALIKLKALEMVAKQRTPEETEAGKVIFNSLQEYLDRIRTVEIHVSLELVKSLALTQWQEYYLKEAQRLTDEFAQYAKFYDEFIPDDEPEPEPKPVITEPEKGPKKLRLKFQDL